ncbi:NEQ377 [Nanoarchaeum equitans Kin4-M]|uniref:NEQ377 n=1 Tax=Nanoarchaeum equitans (strain Kin4-M) TaxID=228908 RepID=Q74N12_NANEQ|nr:NEQ377 [Nanoarchaeum equitans Kin4-M]
MEFCPKDGSILIPKKEGDKTYLVCPVCGYKKEVTSLVIKEEVKKKEELGKGIAEKETIYSKAKGVKCPKCSSEEVVYFTLQTRASDEAETIFYKCLKCGYTWREYE